MNQTENLYEYCLFLKGTLIKDLTTKDSRAETPLFKVSAEVLFLKEEELADHTIRRLLVNRLPQKLEVFMYDHPDSELAKEAPHAVKKEAEKTFLALVISGVF